MTTAKAKTGTRSLAQVAFDHLSGRRRGLALTVAIVVLAVTVAVAVHRDSPLDFYVYYLAGHLVAHGHSAYRVTLPAWNHTAQVLGITHFTAPYRYPPYTAGLVRLLIPLGPFRAMIAWEMLSALALFGAALLLGSALGGRSRTALALLALVCFVPAYHTLVDGQVNAIAFFFLALAFWGLTRGRDGPLGVGIAAAAALKLTPAILVLFLLWRRRWRAALISLAALGVVTLLCLPLTGGGMFADYAPRAFALSEPQRINVSPQNQTAEGAIGRVLASSSSWTQATFSTLERAEVVRATSAVFAVALLVVTAGALWPRRRGAAIGNGLAAARLGKERAGPAASSVIEEQLGFGMVLAVSLVVAPFTFFHQFLWLLILVLVVADRLIVTRRRRLLLALVLLVVAADLNELVWVGAIWAGAIHRFWVWPYRVIVAGGLWRALSLPFVTAVVLWAAACVLVITGGRTGSGRDTPAPR